MYILYTRTAIFDPDYEEIMFEKEIVFTFLNGAKECEAFIVEWEESCLDPLEAFDLIKEMMFDKVEGITGGQEPHTSIE
jgi:hypothetical protein